MTKMTCKVNKEGNWIYMTYDEKNIVLKAIRHYNKDMGWNDDCDQVLADDLVMCIKHSMLIVKD